MPLPTIKVDNISKRYRLGSREGYQTIREAVVKVARSPIKRLKSVISADGGPTDRGNQPNSIWALRDVSFQVQPGEVIGIIGPNGAGKSTLLKVLSKITEPTKGKVELRGRVGSLLEVGTGFHPELTGHENIYLYGAILGMDRWEVTRKFDDILEFAELETFIDTPVKRYSSGMYMRLAFAVAAHMETEILLVDEVLAVGDMAFQKKCLGKMGDVSKQGRTVLFVSHNMAAVQHLCNRAILFENGQNVNSGRPDAIIELYERNVAASHSAGDYPAHIIYDAESDPVKQEAEFEIIRVETVDTAGNAKERVCTWDTVTFRILCWARYGIQTGSAVIQISTTHGVPLLLCSTQPDSAVPMSIKPGYNSVECTFISLPLSAGEYVVGIGLAIPNKEWLCKNEHLGQLSIYPKDVYQSGMAPSATRSILATPHHWRVN